jgi:hypothetical protein
MLTYTSGRNLYAKFTKNNSTENLTYGDTLINESIKAVANYNGGNWTWLEDLKEVKTVASQQAYDIPVSEQEKIADLYVQVGTSIYTPEAVFSLERWKVILASQLGESDVPRFYYIQDGQVLFSPYPATADNSIWIRTRNTTIDLSVADYTTGTILTATNGDKTIVGFGTTWTALMVGRYIKITTPSGDGRWYKIASRTSNTEIELEKNYTGTSIAAGTSTYIIGESSPIPGDYQIALIYRASALYWSSYDISKAQYYWKLYDGGYEAGMSGTIGGLLGQMVDDDMKGEGTYIPPFASTINFINPNYPQPDASGF